MRLSLVVSLALAFIVSVLIKPGDLRAAEIIRVALFTDLSAVTASGNPTLTLESTHGNLIAHNIVGKLEIFPGPKGLDFQGRSTNLRELILMAPGGVIRVNDLAVDGILLIQLQGNTLRVINVLDVEDYLKGVVPVEISPAWSSEALKVQAIIARTYALYQRQANLDREFDLVSTTADQVYRGKDSEHPASNQAIAETAGQVLTYGGELILAVYHSTSAGPTEDASEVWGLSLPYLRGVSCPFDQGSPYYEWTQTLPMGRVQGAFKEAGYFLGPIAGITPFQWTKAGRVYRLRILHSDGELILTGREFRKIIGYTELRSTRFVIEKITREIRFQGSGAGHAVGLCQWGAKEMAEMGYGHKKIVKYYYPGVLLEPYASLTVDY